MNQNPYLAVSAVILSMVFLQAGNGILITLMPLAMGAAGISTAEIGIVATTYSVGFLIGCVGAPHIIRRVGHIRAFAAFAAMFSILCLALSIDVNTITWSICRGCIGLCMAGLMMVSESWVSERTPKASRGRVFSAYMLATKIGLGGAPLLLGLGSIEGPGFFMLISAFLSLSLIPIAMTKGPSPQLPPMVRLNIREFYRIAPAGVVGCVALGMISSAVFSIMPVYAASQGLQPIMVAGLMTAMQLGSLIVQWPIGWLSDRFDRRYIIVGLCSFIVVISIILAVVTDVSIQILYALFAVYGGAAMTVYAVCIAHTADRAKPELMVAMSSSLLFAWSIGGIIGPTAAATVMELIGPGGLFFFTATVSALFVAFVLYRIRERDAVPEDERDAFVSLPPQPGPLTSQMDPRMSEEAVKFAVDALKTTPTASTASNHETDDGSDSDAILDAGYDSTSDPPKPQN